MVAFDAHEDRFVEVHSVCHVLPVPGLQVSRP
jgi:hypothetical protein